MVDAVNNSGAISSVSTLLRAQAISPATDVQARSNFKTPIIQQASNTQLRGQQPASPAPISQPKGGPVPLGSIVDVLV